MGVKSVHLRRPCSMKYILNIFPGALNLKAMTDHNHSGKAPPLGYSYGSALAWVELQCSLLPKGQSAMSSLWARCYIQSPPSSGADVLPDGSHLDPSPMVADSQDSCLVMVVNVTISHRPDSWTECPEKSRC